MLIVQLLFLLQKLSFHHGLELRYFLIAQVLNQFYFQIPVLEFLYLENQLWLLMDRIKYFVPRNLNFYFQGCLFCPQQDKMIMKLDHSNSYLNSKDYLNLPSLYQLNYSSGFESYYLKDQFNYTD